MLSWLKGSAASGRPQADMLLQTCLIERSLEVAEGDGSVRPSPLSFCQNNFDYIKVLFLTDRLDPNSYAYSAFKIRGYNGYTAYFERF